MHEITNNELTKLKVALSHLEKARFLLAWACKRREVAGIYEYTGDYGYFAGKVSDIISSDHGECGLEPFIRKIENK